MKAFFGEPVVRLFLRATVVAGTVFASKFIVFDPTGVHVTYSAAILSAALGAAVLAFSEVFTPLNSVIGILKPPIVPPAKQLKQNPAPVAAIDTSIPPRRPSRKPPAK